MCEIEELDSWTIVGEMLGLILSDENLSLPVYLKEVESDTDIEGLWPVVCIWNEDPAKRDFSLSINRRAVGQLLSAEVARDHPQFVAIREDLIDALWKICHSTVVSMCKKADVMPSELFISTPSPTVGPFFDR